MSSEYKLFVWDGVNKSGKGTVIKSVANWAETQGHPVTTVREPGGTPVGEQIREILLSDTERSPVTDVLLFNAARAATVEKIAQLLVFSHVFADRSYLASFAFQVHGDGMPEAPVRDICRFALGDKYKPAAFFLLDIDYETYLTRLKSDDPNDYFERDRAHFERVREGFLLEARKIGAFIIDATVPEEELQQGVITVIEEML